MASTATFIDEQQEMLAVSNLANLYTLTDKLFGTRGRLPVVEAIHSIATTLTGSDEIAIFEVEPSRTRLTLIAASGIETTGLKSLLMGIGLIGRSAANGEVYERFFDPDATLDGERHLRACIPLKMGKTVIGVVAIFDSKGRYFTQPALNRDWIDVFATHAALALHWTS